MTRKENGRPSEGNGGSGANGQRGGESSIARARRNIYARRIQRLEQLLDHIVTIADAEATRASIYERASDAAVATHLLLAGQQAYLSLEALLRAEEVTP
jgi:hypothetical protein